MNLWARLNADLECVVATMTEQSIEVPPMVFVAPGQEVAWDDCCGGQLWARVIQGWPYQTFPQRDLSLNRCTPPLAIQVGIGILRCVSGLENLDQGTGPTADDLTADAHQMVCDGAAIYEAITCCHADEVDEDFALDQWVTLGPAGGCYGSEWTYYLHPDLTCAPFGSEGSI